jgi:hypothetical protein
MMSGERVVEWYRTHGRPPKRAKREEEGRRKENAEEETERQMAITLRNLRHEHLAKAKDPLKAPTTNVQYVLKEAPELLGSREERELVKLKEFVAWNESVHGAGNVPQGVGATAEAKKWHKYFADLRRRAQDRPLPLLEPVLDKAFPGGWRKPGEITRHNGCCGGPHVSRLCC